MENLNTQEQLAASVVRGGATGEGLSVHGVYDTTCIGPDGQIKWQSLGDRNLVCNQGKNLMLDNLFTSVTFVANKMTLVSSGTLLATSTYAVPTVVEVGAGVIAARAAIGWTAASGGSKAATTTSFAITGSATITGNMVVITATTTVADTAAAGAVLFSSAPFSAGSKVVSSGDTLNVSYTVSV